jgi:hypothetical protein
MNAETRRFLISLAKKRQCPGSGSRWEFLLTRTANMNWLDLSPILGPIPFAVVGAVATRHYMPERMTQDLDIAVMGSDSDAVRAKLTEAGFSYIGELSIGGSSWMGPNSIVLDVLEQREDWWRDGISEAQNNRDLQELPIMPMPHLVLMKFCAGRLQDLADISRMLGLADDLSLEAVRDLFKTRAPEGLDDLESLVALGKLELGQ